MEMLIKNIPGVSDLVAATTLNTKIGVVENKIPNVTDLAKKTDYGGEISEIKKYKHGSTKA